MNVVYCSVIGIPERMVLAETNNNQKYFETFISPILNKIVNNKSILDSIEIDNKKFINYVKHKNLIILLCISNNDLSSEKYKTFFVRFKEILIQEYTSIEKTTPPNPKPLCLQETLNPKLENLMKDYADVLYQDKSLIKEMNNDIEGIRVSMNVMINKVVNKEDDLNELLIKCVKINEDATELKTNANKLEYQTRCMKPWMWILLVIFIILLIAYVCWCLTRCSSFFNPVC